MHSGASKEFKSSAELDNISADELARIVLDPDDPSAINLAHSAFRFPREHWDKILTSPVFDQISDTERFKLMLCHPGDADPNRPQHPDDLGYGQTEADNPLVANLPTQEFLDIKSRVCDGKM